MATFAVLFGTRHIDATEHQDGLMLAIATESVVKLIAFLAVTRERADGVTRAFNESQATPGAFSLNPTVLEIIAVKR